ncbi:DUF1616 domain-containing protein [Natronorubrum sulfidifaciens]
MKDILTRTFRPFVAADTETTHLRDRIPIDLVGVTGFVVIAAVLLAVVDVSSPVVRATVGIPLLFLAPGYVTVAALFPRASPVDPMQSTLLIGQTRDVTDVERAALAFGMSVALLPLLGLLITALSWAFTTTTVVGTVSGFVLAGVVIATGRRTRQPVHERYQFRLGRKLGAVRAAIFGTGSTVHTVVNLVLVFSLLLALTSVGYALVAPQQQGEQYTSLQLLTENESGELVAGGSPGAVEPDEPISFTTAIENQEEQEMEYTVVIQEQWLEDGSVFDRTEVQRTDHRVSAGDTLTTDRDVTPNAESGTVRIAVLLYETDDVPETPTTDNAYRYGYLWIDVTPDGELASDDGAEDSDDADTDDGDADDVDEDDDADADDGEADDADGDDDADADDGEADDADEDDDADADDDGADDADEDDDADADDDGTDDADEDDDADADDDGTDDADEDDDADADDDGADDTDEDDDADADDGSDDADEDSDADSDADEDDDTDEDD